MDPAGSWPYMYNRLAVTGIPSSTVSGTASEFQAHHLTTISPTLSGHTQSTSGSSLSSSPLLLQTAPHTTIISGCGTQNSTFIPGSFLSPPPVGYENVYTPVFQHSKSTNYVNVLNQEQRQPVTQVQVTADSLPEKSESPRESYANHSQTMSAGSDESPLTTNFYAEHQANSSSGSPTSVSTGVTLTWQQNTNNILGGNQQMTSPFGILPHESIVPSSPGSANTTNSKSNNNYETYTNSHYSPQSQNISQLSSLKTASNIRSTSPQLCAGTKNLQGTITIPSGNENSNQYYRQPLTISSSYSEPTISAANVYTTPTKSFPVNSSPSINQTCIVVKTSSSSPVGQIHNNSIKESRSFIATKNSTKSQMYNNTTRNNDKLVNRSSSTNSPVSSNFGIPSNLAATVTKANNHTLHLVQTKAQAKVYPELVVLEDPDRTKLGEIHQINQQDVPISYYTIIDGRLAYTTPGSTNLIINDNSKYRAVGNLQSPRHFLLTNSSDLLTTSKMQSNADIVQYSNAAIQNECSNTIVVPQKHSPPQSASTQIPSPVYPVYNSPMNSIESPSNNGNSNNHPNDNSSHIIIYKSNTPQTQAQVSSPLDSSMSRNSNSGSVGYSSVITRALVNEQTAKIYNSQQSCWTDSDDKSKKIFTLNNSGGELVVPAGIQLKQSYYDPNNHSTQIGALQNLTKTEQPQVTENILVTTEHPLASQVQITQKMVEPQHQSAVTIATTTTPVKPTRRRRNQKTREQLLSENEFLINRVPPPAHCSKTNVITVSEPNVVNIQQQQDSQQLNGNQYFEFDRWTATKLTNSPNIVTNQVTNFTNQSPVLIQTQETTTQTPHSNPTVSHVPYYSNFNVTSGNNSTVVPAISIPSTNIVTNNSSNDSNIVKNEVIKYEHLNNMGTGSNNSSTPYISNNNNKNDNITIIKEEKHSLKVFVPNIEEELEFLSETNQSKPSSLVGQSTSKTSAPFTSVHHIQKSNIVINPNAEKKLNVSNNVGFGFMSSYLKFLEGDRDNSPPPLNRGGRKSIWQRTITTPSTVINAQTTTLNTTKEKEILNTTIQQSTNPLPQQEVQQNVITKMESQQISSSAQNQQNHVSKERKRKTTVGGEVKRTKGRGKKQSQQKQQKQQQQQQANQPLETLNNVVVVSKTVSPTMSNPIKFLPKKARPQMAMQMLQNQNIEQTVYNNRIMSGDEVSNSNQQLTNDQNQQQQQERAQNVILQNHSLSVPTSTYHHYQQREEDPLNLPPIRETSLRKAKARKIDEIMQKKSQFDNDDPEEEPSEFVDSDTDPIWTPHDVNNSDNIKTTAGRKKSTRKNKIISNSERRSCINILNAAVMGAGIDEVNSDNESFVDNQSRLPKEQTAVNPQEIYNNESNDNFKAGDFVVARADLIHDWPPIWQLNSKSILQRFEGFAQNGKMIYKSVSRCVFWNNEKKNLYVKAPVRIQDQNSINPIVELLRSELFAVDNEHFIKELMESYLVCKGNFEVYIQTLISQSLDPNFFNEVSREKDEYFLSNIKVIDDIMNNYKEKLKFVTPWPKTIISSIECWPNYKISTEIDQNNLSQSVCACCLRSGISERFLLFGQSYNMNTLESIQPDPSIPYEKNILLCRKCASIAEILHKICHNKYNLYEICSSRVNERLSQMPLKSKTEILNNLLADTTWIDMLFCGVRQSLAKIENVERQTRIQQAS